MSKAIQDNTARSQFELNVNGHVAFARYERRGPVLVIKHVEAPVPLRGKGAAGELMRGIAETARAEGLVITPYCGYASAWLRRHKDYHDLLN